MLDHILVAVDGSEVARKAARYAYDVARRTGARITLLHVVEPPRVYPVGPFDSFVMTSGVPTEADVKAARRLVDQLASEMREVRVDEAVEVGPVADTICRQAGIVGASHIFVGARGLSAGGRLLLGSVSDRVVHQAGRPVTVVH